MTLYHHIVAVIAVFSAVISGYAMSGIASFIQLVEICNVFLDMKLLLKKNEYHLCAAKVIFISFLLSYFIFRIMLMPTAICLALNMMGNTFFEVDIIRRSFMIPTVFTASILTVMIYYWFWLIMKIVLRLVGVLAQDEGRTVVDKEHD